MALPEDIQFQARQAAGKAWATALALNELAVDAALIDLGDLKTAFDARFVARNNEHLDAIAASTGEKRKAVDDGNSPRQPRRASAPVLALRDAVGELVDDVLGGEEDEIQWGFWTASRLDDVRELIKTWLEVFHVSPLNVLLELERSSSTVGDDDSDDDERYPSLSDDDDELSPLSTSASPFAPHIPPAAFVASDSSPASSPRDDLDSCSDMELSSPPSSPGQDLPDDAPEPRCLRTLEELANFVAEPTEELAMLDIVVPVAAAFDELLTRITTGLASWTQLSVAFAGQVKGKDLQGMRTAAKAMSRSPAVNMRCAHYDVAHAYEFPVSPRSPHCTRVGAYLGALHRTARDHGPYEFVQWLDVLDHVADGGARLTHLEVASLKTIAPNADVLTLRAALTDVHGADLGRTLQALALDQRTGEENWPRKRLDWTLRNLRANQVPVVSVRAPLAGTVAAALAHGLGRAQDESAVNVVALVENRNVRRLSLSSAAGSCANWVLDDVNPASVDELVGSQAWKTLKELCVSNRLSDGFIDALYKSSPRALEVLTVFLADDAPDPADGNLLAPLGSQAWVCHKLTTLVLTATAPGSLASRLLPQVDICVGQRPTVSATDIARFITTTEVARAQFKIILRGVEFAGGLAEAQKVLAGVTIVPDRGDF